MRTGRSRHRLPRARRRARAPGPRRAAADAADQRARRLRGRRHAARVRRGVRRLRAGRVGQGTSRRRGHGRRRRGPAHAVLAAGSRLLAAARGTNILDSGSPFYEAYETADGAGSRSAPSSPSSTPSCAPGGPGRRRRARPGRSDKEQWPAQKARLAAVFRTKTRAEWCELLEHTDACFAPPSPTEAPDHPHNRARHTFLRINDVPQPAPTAVQSHAGNGRGAAHALRRRQRGSPCRMGSSPDEIRELRARGTAIA